MAHKMGEGKGRVWEWFFSVIAPLPFSPRYMVEVDRLSKQKKAPPPAINHCNFPLKRGFFLLVAGVCQKKRKGNWGVGCQVTNSPSFNQTLIWWIFDRSTKKTFETFSAARSTPNSATGRSVCPSVSAPVSRKRKLRAKKCTEKREKRPLLSPPLSGLQSTLVVPRKGNQDTRFSDRRSAVGLSFVFARNPLRHGANWRRERSQIK